jgi:hypothetical protein
MHLQDVPMALIFGMARARIEGLHDGHLRAFAARSAEYRSAEFHASCDKPRQFRLTRTSDQEPV